MFECKNTYFIELVFVKKLIISMERHNLSNVKDQSRADIIESLSLFSKNGFHKSYSAICSLFQTQIKREKKVRSFVCFWEKLDRGLSAQYISSVMN